MWEEKFSEPVDEGRYRNTIFKSSHLLGGKNVLKRKNMQTHFYIIDCMPKKILFFFLDIFFLQIMLLCTAPLLILALVSLHVKGRIYNQQEKLNDICYTYSLP